MRQWLYTCVVAIIAVPLSGRAPLRPGRRRVPVHVAPGAGAEKTAVVELSVYTLLFLLVALVFDRTIDVQFTLPKLMWLRFATAAILGLWVVRLIQGGVRPVPRIVLVPAVVLAFWWTIVTPFAADVQTAIT